MQAKNKLKMTAGLIAVQCAKRTAAEVALTTAQAAEQAARDEEQTARDHCEAAQDDWLHHLSKPGFSPEFSRALSLRLIERGNEAEAAALRCRIAIDSRARRQQAWQLLEAQTRSNEALLRKLERKTRRRREENALSGLADLTTYAWSRS